MSFPHSRVGISLLPCRRPPLLGDVYQHLYSQFWRWCCCHSITTYSSLAAGLKISPCRPGHETHEDQRWAAAALAFRFRIWQRWGTMLGTNSRGTAVRCNLSNNTDYMYGTSSRP